MLLLAEKWVHTMHTSSDSTCEVPADSPKVYTIAYKYGCDCAGLELVSEFYTQVNEFSLAP